MSSHFLNPERLRKRYQNRGSEGKGWILDQLCEAQGRLPLGQGKAH